MNYEATQNLIGLKSVGLALCFVLLAVLPGFATIEVDLKPVEGYVVAAKSGEIIIDLDGEDGIVVGDIFSVIVPGEQLVHPVSKEVIGRLEEVKNVLRVVRIGKGYSFTRSLGDSPVNRGDKIQRFAALEAVFWDYNGDQRELYDQLQHSLSSLKWQDYLKTQRNRPKKPVPLSGKVQTVYFIVDNNALVIRDSNFDFVRQYSLTGKSFSDLRKAPRLKKTVMVMPGTAVQPMMVQANPGQPPASLIDYGVSGKAGSLFNGTTMADLLHVGNKRYLAATDSRKLRVYSLEAKPKMIEERDAQGYGKVLAVSWWQPEAAGLPYLAVLSWSDGSIDSALYMLKNNRLELVKSGIDTILGAFDLDGDSRAETLLGQKFDSEDFFGRRIKEVYWEGSSLQRKTPPLQLPPKFTVIGGQLADLTGDGQLEAAYIRNGTLWIYSGKKRLYASSKQMGGSLSVLNYRVDPTMVDFRTTSAFFEVSPLAVDADGDGRKELLAISSDQSAIRAPGIASFINRSQIVIFNYENGTFFKGNVGNPVGAAIQGLDSDGDQVLYVATESNSPTDSGGHSFLQTLKIQP